MRFQLVKLVFGLSHYPEQGILQLFKCSDVPIFNGFFQSVECDQIVNYNLHAFIPRSILDLGWKVDAELEALDLHDLVKTVQKSLFGALVDTCWLEADGQAVFGCKLF